jgi:hypothetical protein
VLELKLALEVEMKSGWKERERIAVPILVGSGAGGCWRPLGPQDKY